MKRICMVLALVGVLLTGPKAEAAPEVLKFALGDPKGTEMEVMGETFKKYVEDKTNGELKVQLYFSSSLGDETETIHNVRSGALDMTCVGIANLVPFAKRLGVLTLPYLFNNVEEVVAGTSGDAHELLNSYAIPAQLRVLSWTYSGFRHLSNSKHPVTKLADIKGMKIRIPQSTVIMSSYKSWGAIPVLVPWAETFIALSEGTVDGQCYGYIGFRGMRFFEAGQKYMTELHYTYLLQPVVISEKIYQQLPPAWQTIVVEAGKVAQQAVLDYQIKEIGAAREQLVKMGLQITELEDEAEWKKAAMSTVWPEMEAFVGGKTAINAYMKSFGKQEWQ